MRCIERPAWISIAVEKDQAAGGVGAMRQDIKIPMRVVAGVEDWIVSKYDDEISVCRDGARACVCARAAARELVIIDS